MKGCYLDDQEQELSLMEELEHELFDLLNESLQTYNINEKSFWLLIEEIAINNQ